MGQNDPFRSIVFKVGCTTMHQIGTDIYFFQIDRFQVAVYDLLQIASGDIDRTGFF